jgi:PAS domain S-box-containing protein
VYYPIVDARGNVTKVAVFSRDVTERIHAQEELKRQRDQAQLYLDTANVIMVAFNREGRITLLNRNGCELLGVTPEEAVGTDWFKTFLPENVRTEMWGVFETLMAGDWEMYKMYSYYENPVLTSRGEERIVAWHTSLLNDDRGNVIGALSSGTDVTERVRADQKLRESEQRIREITDALPVVVYETDATGRITFGNATAFDLFGYTKEELEAGMSVFQLIAPADMKRARAVFRRRMCGEDIGRIEYAGLRKDGSTFPISIHSALMRPDGAVVGQRGVILGITELKQAEERVEEHTRTIEILNLVMTEGNRAASVQSFAETVTDLTLELLHFDAGTIHIVEDDARRAKLRYVTGLPDTAVEAIREISLNEPPYAAFLVEPRSLFLDGHEVSCVPHVAELGLKSFAVVPLYRYDEIIGAFNVGSFKRHTFSQAEKELLIAIGNEVGVVIAKLQTDELIRAALKERETLLKEIHHRVKNNMQVVSSLLSLQAAQATEPETIEILNESQRQIRSMALIHEKLYSSGSLAEIDFGDYVKSLVDDLLRMYNVPLGTVTITTDIENVQLGVDTAIHCALIINELVSNSLKYAFPDGRTGDVTVALQRANGVHTLTVADDGVGFPADLDFRATDSLGMQLVVMLVNQLDGTITLDRTKGTTFIITFKSEGVRVVRSKGK